MADLKSFQFDIYQRYCVLARALEAAFEKPQATVRLLDLGSGPEPLTRTFTTGDFHIVASDVDDFGKPGIVKLEPGKALPFEPRAFYGVVSMDVLEHVPVEQRGQFIAEAARVAAEVVVLGFPFADPDVREGERMLDQGYLHLWDKHCDFLTEHVDLGLPRYQDAAAALEKAGFKTLTLGVCRLEEWLLYSYLDILYVSIFGAGTEKDEMNRRFNESLSIARRPEGHYRAMVIAARSAKVLERIAGAVLADGSDKRPDPFGLAWNAFESASSLATGVRKKSFQEVYSVVAADLARISTQLGQRTQLEASIAELTHSATQARDTAVALERRNAELSENFAAISRALAEERQRGLALSQQLGQEIDTLRAELAASQEANAQLAREKEGLSANLASLEEERAQIAARAQELGAERDALAVRLEDALRLGRAHSREADEARDRLAELEARHAAERSRLERTESSLAEHRVTLGKLTTRLRCERRARLLDIERIESLSRRR